MAGRGRAAIAVVAVLVNLAVLFAPRAPSVPVGGLPVDKLVHLFVFAWPTYALVRAGLPRRWVVACMVLYAPISELVQQQFLGQRSGDSADVLADLAGVAIGAWLTGPGRAASRSDPAG